MRQACFIFVVILGVDREMDGNGYFVNSLLVIVASETCDEKKRCRKARGMNCDAQQVREYFINLELFMHETLEKNLFSAASCKMK